MVLVPLDALSVAGTVVQFVDFTIKLVSKGNEYYKSASGALVEHKDLELVATNMQKLNDNLNSSLRLFDKHSQLSAEEQALKTVVDACEGIVLQFRDALSKLKISGKNTRWKSFRQAFKSIWDKDNLDEMLRRLVSARQELAINLLVVLGAHSSQEFDSMRKANFRLEFELLSAIETSSANIQDSIKNLSSRLAHVLEQKHKDEIKATWTAKHEPILTQVTTAVSEAVKEDRHRRMRTLIMDSIYFAQIKERRSKIHEAHESTFKWVFGDRPASMPQWSDLVKWLEDDKDGQGIYWVSGKAGSGKSTLMRYLTDNHLTRKHLQVWAGPLKLVTASCFFWNPGNTIQKSLAGLLRSIVYDLLKGCPEKIPLVMPWRWRSYELGCSTLDPWTDSELLDVLQDFFDKSCDTTRICLFIDGLDEFHGNDDTREDLVVMLQSLAKRKSAKICLSSRPWNLFEDTFGTGPMLRLEDLTRNDIRNYVNSKLEQHLRFKALKKQDKDASSKLVLEIVDKAQGVFLWVFLVVRSLAQGLRNEDGFSDLSKRLRLIPADLETYFDQILSTIEPFYLVQSSQLFQVALDADRSLSCLTFSLILEDNPEGVMAKLKGDSSPFLEARCDSMKRRTNALCKGLLEILPTTNSRPYFHTGVDFLHRTVRDFLSTDGMRRKLEGYSNGPFPSHLHLCKALLVQMKTIDGALDQPPVACDFLQLLDEFTHYAATIEAGASCLPSDMILGIKRLVELFTSQKGPLQSVPQGSKFESFSVEIWSKWDSDKTNFLAFLIETGLSTSAVKMIEANSKVVLSKKGRPLLDYALRRGIEALPGIQEPVFDVVQTLLDHGANPNAQNGEDGRTVWHGFLSWMRDHRKEVTGVQAWVTVTEVLIKNDAEQFPTVGAFFREAFDPDEASRLLNLLQQQNNLREECSQTVLRQREEWIRFKTRGGPISRIKQWFG